jgi:hypothetical protein
LWALNVVQDIKEVQRWVAGLSGIWHGRFFLGVPGYDVCYAEHFLYLQFHAEDMNFGHFVPQKDLKAAIQDFRQNVKIKAEYHFNSTGYIPPAGAPLDPNRGRPEREAQEQAEATEEQLFEDDGQGVQEGECRITGSGLDDFGPYRVFGRLNVVYKTVYLAKRYEFETAESQVVYLGGDLGVWGLGGALKSIIPRNGVWKWWKDARDYTLDEMHEMHREAENTFLASVRWRLNRDRLRLRLRTALTNRLMPNAAPGILIGDEGWVNPAFVPNRPPVDPAQLKRGVRWGDIHLTLIDTLIDPVPPPSGPDISKYTEVPNLRGSFPGYVPDALKSRISDEDFVWYDPSVDCGPELPAINSMEDEAARIEALVKHPVSAILTSDRMSFGHTDVLGTLMRCTSTLFQLEHMSESMHVLDDFAQDITGIPTELQGTPPIRRFQGESDEVYTRRRLIFASYTELADYERYIMMRIHRAQAHEDAQYLMRNDIPWQDARKLHITHRWIDVWLRHPVRMFITDQHVLQQKLAQELLSPNPLVGCFAQDILNPETEEELISKQRSELPSQGPVIEDIPDDLLDDEDADLDDEDADLDEDDAKNPRIGNRDTIGGAGSPTTFGWIEAGIALLAGLALVYSIRLLAARNKR